MDIDSVDADDDDDDDSVYGTPRSSTTMTTTDATRTTDATDVRLESHCSVGRTKALMNSRMNANDFTTDNDLRPTSIVRQNGAADDDDDDDDDEIPTGNTRTGSKSTFEDSRVKQEQQTQRLKSSLKTGSFVNTAHCTLTDDLQRQERERERTNEQVQLQQKKKTSGVMMMRHQQQKQTSSSSSLNFSNTIDVSDVSSLMKANTKAVEDLHKRVIRAKTHREKCISLLSNAHGLQLALVEANETHGMLDHHSLTNLKKIMISCLGVLRLCIARVDMVGNLSNVEKVLGVLTNTSSGKKFASLQSDLEIIETQLWNLTGASGGGIAPMGGNRAIASLTRHSRLLRGGFFSALNKVMLGAGVNAMISCGVDSSELWMASSSRFLAKTGILQVTDLFLNEKRELEDGGRLDGKNNSTTTSATFSVCANCFSSKEEETALEEDYKLTKDKSPSRRMPENPRGAITVMTKGSRACSGLLFVGTSAGDVCVWDVDLGRRNENGFIKVRKGVSVTALCVVDDEDDDDGNEEEEEGAEKGTAVNVNNISPSALPNSQVFRKDKFQNCTLWTGFADGSILEIIAKVKIKSRRQSSSIGNSQNTSPGNSWKFNNEVERVTGIDFEIVLRLGRLIRGEADGFATFKRAVKFIVYLNNHVYVPNNNSAQSRYANENLEVWSTKTGKCVASNEVSRDLGIVQECVTYKDADCVVTLHQAEGTFGSALGTVQLWGGRGIAPYSRSAKINEIPFGSLACSVDIVEYASLLIIGHVSGHITIWKLPSVSELDAFATKRVDEKSLNLGVPGKIFAHQSGMVSMCGIHAVTGSHSGIATAGTFGSVLLWPMTELESAADRAIKENGGKMRRKRRQPSQEKLSAGLTTSRTASQDLSPMLSRDQSGSGDFVSKKLTQMSSEKRIASQLNTTLISQSDVDLQQKIGEGSFGRVHVAVWNHVKVAVKYIGTEGMEESSDLRAAMDELEKEVSIMSKLRHPNIVALFGIMRYPPAIVEEFCARGSLFSVLQRHTKPGAPDLQWRVRLRLALGAACGMCYLHNCDPPVIHRDLKSANLMVDASFRVKVGDFNLSRVTAANLATGGMNVSTSVNLHSPRWSAPEVLDTGDYSKASDVYSFGIVLWEILTLQLPWVQWSHWQVLHAVVEDELRPEVPTSSSPPFHAFEQFVQLMRVCWSQKILDRPSFETIIKTLQRIIEYQERFEQEEESQKSSVKNNESSVVAAAAVNKSAVRKSTSMPKGMKLFNNDSPGKGKRSAAKIDNDNLEGGSNENDDDDTVIMKYKKLEDKKGEQLSKNAIMSPATQKSTSILAGIELRKSSAAAAINRKKKSPLSSPSKLLRGLKSISKSADL